MLKKSRFTIEIPINKDRYEMVSLYNTMTRAFILMAENEWRKIFNRQEPDPDTETISELCGQGILVPDYVDETALFELWQQQHVHSYVTMTSKVNVTRKCNNQCTYCILDYEPREMSAATAAAMDTFYIDLIREKRPQQVKDDYIGGEPLLNPGVLIESSRRRFEFCQKEDIDYGFTVTTNGTLLDSEIILRLKESGLSGIRVSLAGPADIHDKLRPAKNGSGTYARILVNLKSVSGLTPIMIECQYDSGARDYRLIPEMLQDLKRQNIDVMHVYFNPILSKRGEGCFNAGLGNPEIALELMNAAKTYGYAPPLEAPYSACRANFRAMFVFDTDGSIIPCPSLREGEMAYGHVRTGIDFVAESQMLIRHLPDKCKNECPILPICMGGCRQQALVYSNDFAGINCQYDYQKTFLDHFIMETTHLVLSGDDHTHSHRQTYA